MTTHEEFPGEQGPLFRRPGRREAPSPDAERDRGAEFRAARARLVERARTIWRTRWFRIGLGWLALAGLLGLG
ncbi:MAG: hypothetical protein IH616_18935, partial [Gemmatimonadales bacterium]|nr:hypothetical protein [Gemmatimonadales bacterium]